MKNNFKAFDINLNDWLNKLQQEINQRDKLLKQIEINKSDKEIFKLNF